MVSDEDANKVQKWALVYTAKAAEQALQVHQTGLKMMRNRLPAEVQGLVEATMDGCFLLLPGARPIQIKDNGDYLVGDEPYRRIESAIVAVLLKREQARHRITIAALIEAGWMPNGPGSAQTWQDSVRWSAQPPKNGTTPVIYVDFTPIHGVKTMGKLASMMAEFKEES